MDAREVLKQELLEVFGARVRTWENMYEMLEEQARAAVLLPHPHIAYGAILMQQSFLQALRELPEEGDITVLAAHTAHLLVYGTGERLGVQVEYGLSGRTLDQLDAAEKDEKGRKQAVEVCTALLDSLRAAGSGKTDSKE